MIRWEIIKLLRRKSGWIFGLVVAFIPVIVNFGLKYGGDIVEARQRVTSFSGSALSISIIMSFFGPFAASWLVSDLTAGEWSGGNLRALFMSSDSRFRLIIFRWAACMVLLSLILTASWGCSIAAGRLLFHDWAFYSTGGTVHSGEIGLVRTAAAFLGCIPGLSTAASVALLLSLIFKNPGSSAALSVGVSLLLQAVGSDEGFFRFIFTSHWGLWHKFFEVAVDWQSLALSTFCLAIWTVALLGLGSLIIQKLDYRS